MANQEPFSFNRNRGTGEKTHHSGNLPVDQGGERVPDEFVDDRPLPSVVEQGLVTPDDTDHPALHDLQRETPTAFVPQSRQNEHLPQKRGLTTRAKMAIAGAAAGAVTIAGAAAGAAVYSINKNVENTIDDTLPDQNTSAPQTPGEEDPSGVKLDPPEYEAFGMPYEEATKPAELTSEQLAQWNSGDSQIRNEIVDQLLRDRTSYALTDLLRTNGTDQIPDLSYVTHDPAVISTFEELTSRLPIKEGVYGVELCPLDSSGAGVDQMCHPSNFANPNDFAPEIGNDVVIHTNMISEENYFIQDPELFKGFKLDIHPEVDSDGIITWAHN